MKESWLKVHDNMDSAFQNNTVTNASDEQLQEWLQNLGTEYVQNQSIQHREIIRSITINNIIMKRHIDKLNTQNAFTQKCVIALTIASLIGTGIQVYYANKSEKDLKHKNNVLQ